MEDAFDNLSLETSESLVTWLAASLTARDFDESAPDVSNEIHRKLTDAIVARGEESVEPLVSILAHKDWAVRSAAVSALGRLQSSRPVNKLIECLRVDQSRYVQAAVANALYEIGDPRGIEIARQWKRQTRENDEDALRHRLNNFIALGHAETTLHRRLQELADHYDVDPKDIAVSCLTYTSDERQQVRDGDAVAVFSSVMMTEEEYHSIQEIG